VFLAQIETHTGICYNRETPYVKYI